MEGRYSSGALPPHLSSVHPSGSLCIPRGPTVPTDRCLSGKPRGRGPVGNLLVDYRGREVPQGRPENGIGTPGKIMVPGKTGGMRRRV